MQNPLWGGKGVISTGSALFGILERRNFSGMGQPWWFSLGTCLVTNDTKSSAPSHASPPGKMCRWTLEHTIAHERLGARVHMSGASAATASIFISPSFDRIRGAHISSVVRVGCGWGGHLVGGLEIWLSADGRTGSGEEVGWVWPQWCAPDLLSILNLLASSPPWT